MRIRQFHSLALTMSMLAVSGQGQPSVVRWWAFDMGFSSMRSGNTVILSAVGQPLVGASRAGGTEVISGFLVDTLFVQKVVAVEKGPVIPEVFSLDQNYPNPFNPMTTINYSVPCLSHVRLVVYSILGQEVSVLVDEDVQAGYYRVRFDARTLATGTYMYRMQARPLGDGQAGVFVRTLKFLLLK